MTGFNRPRVLDVGQCDLDHGRLAGLLSEAFGAEVDRAAQVEEAVARLQDRAYALVLVNRVLDGSHVEGLELIRRMQADEQLRSIPVMLVSNYREAQEAAVAVGARPGFGKAELGEARTRQLLATVLKRQHTGASQPLA